MLYKNIFQIKYRPDLKFFELLIPSSRKLTEYKDWENDGLNIILMDLDNHCSLSIRHDSITYEQDSDSRELSNTRIDNIIKILLSSLEINKFNRFGYREQYLISTDIKFESLVKLIHKKLYKQHDELNNIFPKVIDDLAYRINFNVDDYLIFLTLGPLRKKEVPRQIKFDVKKHLPRNVALPAYNDILKSYPDVSIFIDLDVIKQSESNSIDLKEIKKSKDFAVDKIDSIVNNINKYIFSTL